MRTILSLCAAVAALTFLVGCGGKSVVGKWDVSMSSTDPQMSAGLAQMGTMKEALEFKADDTYAMTTPGMTDAGTYKVEGDKVTLTSNQGGEAKTFDMAADGTTLTATEGQITINVTRSAAAE